VENCTFPNESEETISTIYVYSTMYPLYICITVKLSIITLILRKKSWLFTWA